MRCKAAIEGIASAPEVHWCLDPACVSRSCVVQEANCHTDTYRAMCGKRMTARGGRRRPRATSAASTSWSTAPPATSSRPPRRCRRMASAQVGQPSLAAQRHPRFSGQSLHWASAERSATHCSSSHATVAVGLHRTTLEPLLALMLFRHMSSRLWWGAGYLMSLV